MIAAAALSLWLAADPIAPAVPAAPVVVDQYRYLTIVESPEVAGRRVTFRLRAPRAREVRVVGSFAGTPLMLERDVDGVWSGTVGPLAPGVYTYNFTVDGLQIVDPGNAWQGGGRWVVGSIFQILGGDGDEEPRGAPRGALVVREYEARGSLRRVHVYTPPGYERGGTYPTVYLLHGFSDTDATWSLKGRVHVVLDNLIASRRIPPLVAVMPDGQPLAPHTGQETGRYYVDDAAALARELRDQLLPLVETHFRVRRGASNRLALGVDMGAYQALVCADQFRGVAAVDAPLLPEGIAATPVRWLSIVLAPQHPRLAAAQRLTAELSARGVAATVVTRPLDKNVWPRWRLDVSELLPRMAAAQQKR